MITSSQFSAACVFGMPQWRPQGEIKNAFDVEETLYTLAFDLAAVFQQENVAMRSTVVDKEYFRSIVEQLDAAMGRMYDLLQQMRGVSPIPPPEETVDFWDLSSAVARACVCALDFHTSIRVRGLVSRIHEEDPDYITENALLASLSKKYTYEREENIVRTGLVAVKYSIGDEMGLYGGQRCLFPIRMIVCKLTPEFPFVDDVYKTYEEMVQKKGLRHARDLERVWGH